MKPTIDTADGLLELEEYRLRVKRREWSAWHAGVVSTPEDQERAVAQAGRVPYGLMLWSSAIVLGREVAARAGAFSGKSVLELGAGAGLPGIVAATLGARVVQVDADEWAVELARRNGARNAATGIEYRVVHWTRLDLTEKYDWIIGSDILYADCQRQELGRVFANGLQPGGKVLWTNPRTDRTMFFIDDLEDEGWRLGPKGRKRFHRDEFAARPIYRFEMTLPDVSRPDRPGA